jgi:HD superfamily phosphohydrolase
MDYLLRDSYHVGVPYGRFDHFRLIDTLRILPSAVEGASAPALGVEEGGLQSAEALLLGRYYMYSQVYFHPIRRIYDIHLKDFLAVWLSDGKFPTDIELHLRKTDNDVNAAIAAAALDGSARGHEAARRIARHDHFKVVYQRHPDDVRTNTEAGQAVYDAARAKFGDENVRRDSYTQKREATRFPVLLRDERIGVAEEHSDVLRELPVVAIDYVFIKPDLLEMAGSWLKAERESIIQAKREVS